MSFSVFVRVERDSPRWLSRQGQDRTLTLCSELLVLLGWTCKLVWKTVRNPSKLSGQGVYSGLQRTDRVRPDGLVHKQRRCQASKWKNLFIKSIRESAKNVLQSEFENIHGYFRQVILQLLIIIRKLTDIQTISLLAEHCSPSNRSSIRAGRAVPDTAVNFLSTLLKVFILFQLLMYELPFQKCNIVVCDVRVQFINERDIL